MVLRWFIMLGFAALAILMFFLAGHYFGTSTAITIVVFLVGVLFLFVALGFSNGMGSISERGLVPTVGEVAVGTVGKVLFQESDLRYEKFPYVAVYATTQGYRRVVCSPERVPQKFHIVEQDGKRQAVEF